MKREADQVKRRQENEQRESIFANSVVEKEKAKLRLRDQLQDKYAIQREDNLDVEELRKTEKSDQFKSVIMQGLNEQAIAKRKEKIAEKQKQDELDKAQITAAVERDDKLNSIQRKKDEERRQLGKYWMQNAEEQYQKKIANA